MTDEIGMWEHAEYLQPRIEHGLCTDDNARALIVVCREALHPTTPDGIGDLGELGERYLRFVLDSRTPFGFHNRRRGDGRWDDEIGSDDSQGRAWWALGTAARTAPKEWMRSESVQAFDASDGFRSSHLRANAFAVLGAVELLTAQPSHRAASDLCTRAVGVIASAATARIPWPEERLTYDNARIPEALLAAGSALGERRYTAMGLRLAEWLVSTESNGGHFSFTPVGGWAPGEPRPAFDQQPIEAWAMADLCLRVWQLTGADQWRLRARRAAQWMLGDNDLGLALYDLATGAGYDGLTGTSVNENCGAESTLSGVACLQVAAATEPVAPDLVTR
ncbi:MAG: glycosyltransferase [Acidimicrobiia bacterium]